MPHMEHTQTVGQRIKAKRVARKLTQRKLAEAAGVSLPYLSRIESGLRQPPLDTLERIATGLGCRVHSLIPARAP